MSEQVTLKLPYFAIIHSVGSYGLQAPTSSPLWPQVAIPGDPKQRLLAGPCSTRIEERKQHSAQPATN